MSWRTTWAQSLGTPPEGNFVNMSILSGHAEVQKTAPILQKDQNQILDPIDRIDKLTKIPPLTSGERQEINAWPPETRRVFTRILAHFQERGFSQDQAERLSLTTINVLRKRKGWPLVLVQDLPPEIGRAVGLVLDVFPGAKITKYGHKAGTAL